MSPFLIQFLTRDGCHLCEAARPDVEWAASRAGVGVEVVDIDTRQELVDLYDLRVPVVLAPDDSVLAEGHIDKKMLRKTLNRIS